MPSTLRACLEYVKVEVCVLFDEGSGPVFETLIPAEPSVDLTSFLSLGPTDARAGQCHEVLKVRGPNDVGLADEARRQLASGTKAPHHRIAQSQLARGVSYAEKRVCFLYRHPNPLLNVALSLQYCV